MRLLNTESMRLESFFGSAPRYAILSHTWEEEEILFEDISNPEQSTPVKKKGWEIVDGSCRQARLDGYEYVWIDTCCIDKSSSAELSEAINSMFMWYHNASRCYVYLADYDRFTIRKKTDIKSSRWFTRGWTLQELIAPRDVEFYDCNWFFIGRRQVQPRKPDEVHEESKDSEDGVLDEDRVPDEDRGWERRRRPAARRPSANLIPLKSAPVQELVSALASFSIAQKMSWAARRQTTRPEDEAYSLLGIFGVNMPLLYGEGRQAFFRLQQEIVRLSNDQSILAFVHQPRATEAWSTQDCPLLADSPACFAGSGQVGLPDTGSGAFQELTELSPSQKALETRLYLWPVQHDHGESRGASLYFAILDSAYPNDLTSHPAIVVRALDDTGTIFTRFYGHLLVKLNPLFMTADTPRLAGSVKAHFSIMPACGLWIVCLGVTSFAPRPLCQADGGVVISVETGLGRRSVLRDGPLVLLSTRAAQASTRAFSWT
ncbi:heterokaryon incompatibility protein-domain-containing protein [Staphylotrichum tortipilum]|uniref:Heterokaryon incompatibility protein-domain-containing protein n=1 Tax=Staphylotrichum tortipilum TaxID=2831512 RepID=A0AAN6RSY9_9PEZI|nr:heterokaryon incompatibility protein-domain-containing protein [Staphylotrichum longicolle]